MIIPVCMYIYIYFKWALYLHLRWFKCLLGPEVLDPWPWPFFCRTRLVAVLRPSGHWTICRWGFPRPRDPWGYPKLAGWFIVDSGKLWKIPSRNGWWLGVALWLRKPREIRQKFSTPDAMKHRNFQKRQPNCVVVSNWTGTHGLDTTLNYDWGP